MPTAEDRMRRAARATQTSNEQLEAATERLKEAIENSDGIPLRELSSEDSLVIALGERRDARAESPPPPAPRRPRGEYRRARTAR